VIRRFTAAGAKARHSILSDQFLAEGVALSIECAAELLGKTTQR